ncbi:DUF4870 domain-containing protein [Dokdonella sp.]|uniref:DUF4870 domain-containing protein n=1 Tax=Dokdonella sp. TaxID=2291710 RepID=UPI003C3DFA86
MNVETEPQAEPQPDPHEVVAPVGDERTWALLGHLSAFSAFIVAGLGCVLGPLIIWLIKRDTLPFAGDQAKEALNFNITILLAGLALWIVTVVTLGIGLLLTVPLGLALFAYWLVFTIVAAVNANNGIRYRYPFTLRLVE